MNIWRLIPHHEYPAEFAEWSRRNGTIAIGWGGTGDLRKHDFHNEAELKQMMRQADPTSSGSSCANGARSLWRLYHEMQPKDLVILSAKGSRKLVMRVTGDYYFVPNGDDLSHGYEHRRRAEVTQIDPNHLWHEAKGAAPGEGVYTTLVRCAHQGKEEALMAQPLITRSDTVLGGTPVFAGTRVPVKMLFDYLKTNHPLNDFLDDFPTVTREQAIFLLEQAKQLTD